MANRDYSITGPDGRTLTINGPDNATPAQLKAAAQRAFALPAAEPEPQEESFPQQLGRQVLNAGAGAIRGAGSIGATLLAPIDAAARAVGIENSVIGRKDRRQSMTDALGSMGADTDSIAFGAGKLGAEVAGTLGAGGAVANTAARVLPRAAAMGPNLPGVAATSNLLSAIRTSGMSGGNALTRAAGGAVAGGVSAGLVDPEQAGIGAAVGGVLPGAVQVAGMAGNALGRVIKGPTQTADMAAAVQRARDAGYVIPPTQANPSLKNRLLEGFSGKLTTAQNASASNQAVSNELAAKAIGLPAETKITTEVLDSVRAEAGKAYAAIAKLGPLDAGAAKLPAGVSVSNFTDPMTLSKRSQVDAGELVRAWKQSNADATSYFRAYGRDANPETLAKAKAAASDAKAVDEFLQAALTTVQKGSKKSQDQLIAELSKGYISPADYMRQSLLNPSADAAKASGNQSLLDALKDARRLIAKTYTVEKALNPTTGAIDARKLAAELKKGKPLTGELKAAADFAAQFPKAAQTVEGMGSLPQTSPLDWGLAGGLSMATSNPLMLATVMARPAARAAVLSPMVQNRLIQGGGGPNALQRLAANPELAQLGYRAAPTASSGR